MRKIFYCLLTLCIATINFSTHRIMSDEVIKTQSYQDLFREV